MAKRLAIGLVARCRKGMTGLILGVRKVGQPPREPKAVYTGICLDRGRVGQSWQSMYPDVIGTLDDWVMKRAEELHDEAHAEMNRSLNRPVTPRSLK